MGSARGYKTINWRADKLLMAKKRKTPLLQRVLNRFGKILKSKGGKAASDYILGVSRQFPHLQEPLFKAIHDQHPLLLQKIKLDSKRLDKIKAEKKALEKKENEERLKELDKQRKIVELGLADRFENFTPREFEELIGVLFERMGYNVEIGSYVNDMGVDVVARKENEVILIETKKWKEGNNVGNDIVRSVLGGMWKVDANKAIVVTSSDFTVSAQVQAEDAPVEIRPGQSRLR